MTAPVITALGVLSPLGLGRTAFERGWREGAGAVASDGDGPPLARLARFRARDFLPGAGSMLRRMDRLSSMICVSAAMTCEDAGLGEDTADLALGVGTDLGTLDETWRFLSRLRDKGPALANPLSFPNLVPNAGAGYAGILLGMQGPSQTFCQHEICGEEAIGWAADGIRAGRFSAALGGGAEELGEIRLRAEIVANCGPQSGVPGEGAAMVLLEGRERAQQRGARVLAEYLGTWTGRTPSRSPLAKSASYEGLGSLLERALDEAGHNPAQLGVMLLSAPDDPLLAEVVHRVVDRDLPSSDHHVRVGLYPADGALRVALCSLLLADPTLSVNAGGELRAGPVALVLTVGRGGVCAVTLLRESC